MFDSGHSKLDMRHSKSGTEHSMFDMEHSKFGFEHSKSDMEHSKFGMEQILCVKIDMLFNFIHAFYIFLTVDFGFSRFLRVKNSWHKLSCLFS